MQEGAQSVWMHTIIKAMPPCCRMKHKQEVSTLKSELHRVWCHLKPRPSPSPTVSPPPPPAARIPA